MEIHKSYYAIIPANVRYDKNLSPNCKLLYGEITALCNQKGYCWASNEYFAKLYKVTKQSIKNWIRILKENEYITTEMVFKENSQEILQRNIRLNVCSGKQNLPTPRQNKLPTPGKDKLLTPSKDNLPYNNTDNNITLFNNLSINHDEMEETIKQNIGYDFLCSQEDENEINNIVKIMVDTICNPPKQINICGCTRSYEQVKNVLLSLNETHIQSVLLNLADLPNKPHNMKSYLLSCLFNSSMTSSLDISSRYACNNNVGKV